MVEGKEFNNFSMSSRTTFNFSFLFTFIVNSSILDKDALAVEKKAQDGVMYSFM